MRLSLSEDEGTTWGASVQLDGMSEGGTGILCSIAGSGGSLFAVFDVHDASQSSAYFRASPDGGLSWPDPMVRMNDSLKIGGTEYPVVVGVAPSVVHAAWADSNVPGGAFWIYTSRGTHESSALEDPMANRLEPLSAGLHAYPNPAGLDEFVRLRLDCGPRAARDEQLVEVHDATGRLLHVLCLTGGAVTWDGCDGLGHPVPSGCYWLRVPGSSARRGLVLVRVR